MYSSPNETTIGGTDSRNNNVVFTVDKQGKFETLKTTVDLIKYVNCCVLKRGDFPQGRGGTEKSSWFKK